MANTIAAAAPSAPAIAKTGTGALSTLSGNFNDFLKLLMTQLQNQDPTSPMDTNQFTSQLVQYSSVEQQINTNSSLTKLIELQQGNEVLQSSALVGKSVQVTSDHIALQGGMGAVTFTTAGPEPVAIGIYTEGGAKIRDATLTTKAGANTWQWDGRDNNGRAMPDGAYKTIIGRVDAAGATQSVPFTVTGTATGVVRTGTALNVQIGSLNVPLSSVQGVK